MHASKKRDASTPWNLGVLRAIIRADLWSLCKLYASNFGPIWASSERKHPILVKTGPQVGRHRARSHECVEARANTLAENSTPTQVWPNSAAISPTLFAESLAQLWQTHWTESGRTRPMVAEDCQNLWPKVGRDRTTLVESGRSVWPNSDEISGVQIAQMWPKPAN